MNIEAILDQFKKQHVLVIGDVMLDTYTFGEVSRISPEAPVPIVNITHTQKRLGGAANVALNLKSVGAQVSIVSLVGNDEAGADIKNLLLENGIDFESLYELENRKTTVKNRVIANKHQMLRLDIESTESLSELESQGLLEKITHLFSTKKIDAIIFEDYDKGTLNKFIIQKTIAIAKTKNIPTTVDPKKNNFDFYNGATLFKPNLRELHEGIGFKGTKSQLIMSLPEIGKEYCNMNSYGILFTTLSEHGVFICDSKLHYNETAHLRSIADVSGAGDTVIAIATLCLAVGLSIKEIASISNIAGGLVCEKLGVVPIDIDELKRELSVIQ